MGFYSIFAFYRRYPFVGLVIFLLAGTGIAAFSACIIVPAVLMILCFIGILVFKSDQMTIILWLLQFLFLGWINYSFQSTGIEYVNGTINAFARSTVEFSGIVEENRPIDQKSRLLIRNFALASPGNYYCAGINYYFYSELPVSAEIGDTLTGKGIFHVIGKKRNPGDFNFKSFYQRKNIYGRIYLDNIQPPEIQPGRSISAWQIIEACRSYIRVVFYEKIGGRAASLLQALILGDKTEIDPEVTTAFADIGVIHVLAVSGLHVGYVLIILMSISRILRIPWGWDRLAIILGLVIFVILTGAKPSVSRAALMTGLYILAPVVNRTVSISNIIGLAAFFILIIKPLSIHDLGFLLSFTAVISIVYFYQLFEKLLPVKLRISQIKNNFVKYTWALFLVSLAAQIGTLPLTIYYFHRLPVIALAANVIIVPVIGLLVALGFALLFFSWIPWIGWALGNCLWLIAEFIIGLTGLFAKIPYGAIDVSFPGLPAVLIFLAVILIAELAARTNQWPKIVIVGLLIVNIVIWKWAVEKYNLDILYLNVGQGDAIIIQFPGGETMLIDGSYRYHERDMGKMVILPATRYLGIKRFDYLVMTHPHNDHIGGLISVIESFEVSEIWDIKSSYNSRAYNTIHDLISTRDIVCKYPANGDIFRIDDQTAIQIFCPPRRQKLIGNNINNNSIVFRLIYGDMKFLFTGDLEYEGEQRLMEMNSGFRSAVLKVAHHGSITSTSPAFLDAVSPDYAVISVGAGNKFGHPSPQTLQRLEQVTEKTWRTDLDQAVWLRSDGRKIAVVEWQ